MAWPDPDFSSFFTTSYGEREQRGEALSPAALGAAFRAALAACPAGSPTPDFSFFLLRPLEVFSGCILSVLSISPIVLAPTA